eukprot:g67369.t1
MPFSALRDAQHIGEAHKQAGACTGQIISKTTQELLMSIEAFVEKVRGDAAVQAELRTGMCSGCIIGTAEKAGFKLIASEVEANEYLMSFLPGRKKA